MPLFYYNDLTLTFSRPYSSNKTTKNSNLHFQKCTNMWVDEHFDDGLWSSVFISVYKCVRCVCH